MALRISPHDFVQERNTHMTGTFFGEFDLASLSIWLFWGY